MTTINTHSLSIGETELTEPIPDYRIEEILGGRLIPSQGLSKALARQVKELRKQLRHGCVPGPVLDRMISERELLIISAASRLSEGGE